MQDWSDQIADMQKQWVEQQQKLMNDWLESMKRAGSGAPQTDWGQAADIMEQHVTSALDAQKRSLQAIAGNMQKVEGAPEELTQAVRQMEEGIERWTEVQSKIWKVWFDALRQVSPSLKSPGETVMENWEDMVKRTMSIQEQWLSNWTGSPGAAGRSSSKKTKKKTSSTGSKRKKKTSSTGSKRKKKT